MRVDVSLLEPRPEPKICLQRGQVLATILRPGALEVGLRRSAMAKLECFTGQMLLCPRDVEQWIRTEEIKVLKLFISDDALEQASGGRVELRSVDNLLDARVGALVAAVDAERVAGFPSGQLFLDSVEQAIAVALVDRHAKQRPARPVYREGLTPSRLRRVTEFVQANIDGDLTLGEMAESVEMSVAYFAHMFRKSTGQSPHQFVLHSRVERAKALLRSRKFRVLDVAVACGFKTQQHFARVFRRICGVSPMGYRNDVLESNDWDSREHSTSASPIWD